MNISSRNKYCLIFVTALLCTQVIAAPDEKALVQAYEMSTGSLPGKLDYTSAKDAETLINGANCIYGDLACLVQEDSLGITEKAKKIEVLQEITQTRRIIQQLLKELMNTPTKLQLSITLQVIRAILEDLETSLNTDFAKYKAFSLESMATRSIKVDDNIDEKELKKILDQTKEYCKTIQKLSENAGLYWYNHLYRNTFDRFVIQPSDKHNLHWKTFYTLAGCAAFTYVWYQMNTSINGCSAHDAGKPEDTDMSKFCSYNPEDPMWKQIPGKAHDLFNGFVRRWCGWSISNEESSGSVRYGIKLDEGFNQVAGGIKNFDTATLQLDNQSKQLIDSLNEIIQQIEHTENPPKELLEALNKTMLQIKNPPKELLDAFSQVSNELIKVSKTLNRENKLPQKWLAQIDQAGYNIAYSRWAPFMSMLWIPYHGVVEEQYYNVKYKISKKISQLHHWLKGGAYYQQYKLNENEFRIKPRFTFDDLIGHDHAKKVLGDIVKYIQDPELYERAGLVPEVGYLLYGPTRTGKSMIAEALAGELKKAYGGSEDDFPFFSVDARHLAAKNNFDTLLNIAKRYAPCIIFIDEIDLLNLTRVKGKQNLLLSEFLSSISGCMNNAPDKKVILIGACNKPEDLDTALLARFREKIPFDYPSFLHRAEYIAQELEGKGLPLDQFDIKKLAEQTESCSFEQLHKIINKAQFIARETGKPVTQVDIEQCINTEVRHIIYHDYKMLSEDELDILSLHMIGHAMAYKLIESKAKQLSQVTIRPIKTRIRDDAHLSNGDHQAIKYGQIFTHSAGDSLKLTSQNDCKRKCMIAVAGAVAEQIVLDNTFITKSSCSAHDKTDALYWAKRYFLDGLDEEVLANSKALQNKITEQAYAFVEECKQEVRTLFEEHKDLIVFLADVLKKFEVLNTEQLDEIIELHKMLDGRSLEEFVKEMQDKMANPQSGESTALPADPVSEITVPE